MLESLFIVMIILAFIMTLYAHEERSVIFAIASVVFWLLIMANAIYIQVPFSTGDNTYMELGFGALVLLFIFLNIIQAIIFYSEWKEQNQIL